MPIFERFEGFPVGTAMAPGTPTWAEVVAPTARYSAAGRSGQCAEFAHIVGSAEAGARFTAPAGPTDSVGVWCRLDTLDPQQMGMIQITGTGAVASWGAALYLNAQVVGAPPGGWYLGDASTNVTMTGPSVAGQWVRFSASALALELRDAADVLLATMPLAAGAPATTIVITAAAMAAAPGAGPFSFYVDDLFVNDDGDGPIVVPLAPDPYGVRRRFKR